MFELTHYLRRLHSGFNLSIIKSNNLQILFKKTSLLMNFQVINFPKNESESHSVMSGSLRPHGLQPTRLLRPWDLSGKSTGVGCYFAFSRIATYQQRTLWSKLKEVALHSTTTCWQEAKFLQSCFVAFVCI